jgi:hypothetical protein
VKFTKRSMSVLGAVVAVLVSAALSFAASADAAPYHKQPKLSVSTTTPAVGATITVTGTDYGANETVELTLHTAVYTLGSAHTDASGGFTTSVTLPAGVSGTHTLVGTGMTSGGVASVTLVIGGSGTGGTGGSNGGGGLSNTGAAVIGVGALGITLLIAGGFMLVAGRRRKAQV